MSAAEPAFVDVVEDGAQTSAHRRSILCRVRRLLGACRHFHMIHSLPSRIGRGCLRVVDRVVLYIFAPSARQLGPAAFQAGPKDLSPGSSLQGVMSQPIWTMDPETYLVVENGSSSSQSSISSQVASRLEHKSSRRYPATGAPPRRRDW